MTIRPTAAQIVRESLDKAKIEAEHERKLLPGLQALAQSMTEEDLSDEGFIGCRAYVDDNLRRLGLILENRRKYPDIANVKLSPQMFILGMPRCGTSILHALIASDPQFRAPLMWEVGDPSPPPEAATFLTDPRIKAFDDYVTATFTGKLADMMKAHPIGAQIPQECGTIMETSFHSSNPSMLYRLGSFFQWFLQADKSYAYEVHKMWLQHMQWRNPRDYWVLKIQEHMFNMPQLTAAYPDAVIVQPHRDPVTVIASISRLIQVLRSASFDHQDANALGREMIHLWYSGLEKLMEYRRAHPELKVYDMSYKKLVADPVGEVRSLYENFGIPFSAESEAGIRRWLQENPAGKHGKHTYRMEDYGLTDRNIVDVYGPYIETYRNYM